ncbi:MAG: hypothetical protein IKJ74_03260 [Clostridia bacterium]|nr:hypothetical protein [Clostridia bacterium]
MERKMFARYPIGNPKRTWKQDNMVIAVSSPGPLGLDVKDEISLERTRRGVETALTAGFNLQETLWASPEVGETVLRTAEQIGAKVIYQNLGRFGGMGFSKKVFHEKEDLEGVIRDTKMWNCIAGYYVYDEPTNEDQRKVTAKLIEVMERECPHLLPYTVAAAKPSYIDPLADEVSPAQLSFDIYPFGNIGQELCAVDQLDRCNFWVYMSIAYSAAKRIGAPLWFYYQGHQLFYKPSFDRYTFAASRMMANAALLYGAKGISAYVEFDGFVDPATGGKGVHFEEQKKLNEETAKLGNTLMALDCLRVIHDESLQPDTEKYKEHWEKGLSTMEDSELLEGQLPNRLSISELTDAYGHKYLMVLNRDYRLEHHFCLKLKTPSRVYRVSEEDGLERMVYAETKKLKGHLTPGSLALYRIQPVEEEPYLVEYYLEKANG